MIINWAVLGFEEEEYFLTKYGHDSQWSMAIWTNSQSRFNSRMDMKFGGNWPTSFWRDLLLLLCGFLILPGTQGTQRQRRLLCTCICTALLSWITHAHLVLLSVTKRRPIYFILNPGHVEWARLTNGLKIVLTRAGFEPTISCLKVTRPPSPREVISQYHDFIYVYSTGAGEDNSHRLKFRLKLKSFC